MSSSPSAVTANEPSPTRATDAGLRPAAGAWSGVSNDRVQLMTAVALLFPLAAGLAVFGWRAAAGTAVVVVTAVVAAAAWQRVGRRGSRISIIGIAILSLLLAMTLPGHLFSLTPLSPNLPPSWPILPAAGIVLTMLCWMLGGTSRIHPVLLTHLLLVVLFQPHLDARHVLKPEHALRGDLLDAPATESASIRVPWIAQRQTSDDVHDAFSRVPVSARLTPFTTGRAPPERAWLSLEGLIRDRLPAIEDLIVAGEPGPVGCASAVAVIVGGLFLLYRGLIDYRIPLLIIAAAFLTFLILPVPIVVTDQGPQWRWLAFRASAAGWGVAITFANYEVLASPLLLMAMFIAPSASIRPMSRRWRPVFAVVAGVLTAALQLYVNVATAPYMAILIAGLLTPAMDRGYRSRA